MNATSARHPNLMDPEDRKWVVDLKTEEVVVEVDLTEVDLEAEVAIEVDSEAEVATVVDLDQTKWILGEITDKTAESDRIKCECLFCIFFLSDMMLRSSHYSICVYCFQNFICLYLYACSLKKKWF